MTSSQPINLSITMQDVHDHNTELRVVLLDHILTQNLVQNHVRGYHGEQNCNQALLYPAYPYFRFGILAMGRHVGWYPMDCDDGKKFDMWLLSHKVFGPLREARNDTDESRAMGMAWVSALWKTGDVAEEKLQGEVEVAARVSRVLGVFDAGRDTRDGA